MPATTESTASKDARSAVRRPGATPADPAAARAAARGLLVAVVVVTVLAVVDVSAGPTVVVVGLLTVGPCLAAIAGSPRVVLAVGGYVMVLLALLSWPDNLWWTLQQLIYVLALAGVTAVSAVAAERRRREEQRLLAAEAEVVRAHAAGEASSAFLSRVSHELRTPLNAVLGFTQFLQRDDLTPAQHDTTDQIARAGKHLLALVDDVLDVTAAEAGELSLRLAPVSVGAAVRDALELTEPQAQVRGVTLHDLLGSADDWYVLADATRLRQVVMNLLSNAVTFDSPDGDVTVGARRTGAGTVAISVDDTGPGIARQGPREAVTPFERLDAGRAGIEGTGLGLAVSRRLAEAMGGTLTAASREGLGATFTLTLPECGPPPTLSTGAAGVRTGVGVPRMKPGTPPAPRLARQARVLYVEDNVSNLRLVERILELRPGWQLTHAADGATGLDLALSAVFDLVLLDKNLPDLHGLEVLRQLRSRENRLRVPVVILSADAASGKVSQAIRRRRERLPRQALLRRRPARGARRARPAVKAPGEVASGSAGGSTPSWWPVLRRGHAEPRIDRPQPPAGRRRRRRHVPASRPRRHRARWRPSRASASTARAPNLRRPAAAHVVEGSPAQLQAVTRDQPGAAAHLDLAGLPGAPVDPPQTTDGAVVEHQRTVRQRPDAVRVQVRAVEGGPLAGEGQEGRRGAARPAAAGKGIRVSRSTRESVTHTASFVTTRSLRNIPPVTATSATIAPVDPSTAQTRASVPRPPAAQTRPERGSRNSPRSDRPGAPGNSTDTAPVSRSPVTIRPSASEPT